MGHLPKCGGFPRIAFSQGLYTVRGANTMKQKEIGGILPPEFEEIARLSDIARAESGQTSKAHSNPELAEHARAGANAVYESGKPTPIFTAMMALSDESFKRLSGWTLFGRDYTYEQGDPFQILQRYIDSPQINPREAAEAYLSQKPIGKYLRRAVDYLENTTNKDIERAGEEDEDEN
jgi:hypothetical protein